LAKIVASVVVLGDPGFIPGLMLLAGSVLAAAVSGVLLILK
jgi:hypothetical protein